MKSRARSPPSVGLFSRVKQAKGVFLLGLAVGLSISLFYVYFSPPAIRYRPVDPVRQSNDTILKELVKRDFQLVLLTTSQAGYQERNIPHLFNTWLKGYEDILDVVSDGEKDQLSTGLKLPGYIDALKYGCGTDREYGLICKNNIIFKKWIHDPKMKNKKWFFRFMDDTWAHLENMYEYLATLDHTKPIVVGDLWCHRDGWTYPSGGPGIIFSRGFWDTFDFDLWKTIPGKYISTVDDVSMGGYIQTKKVEFLHHHGMSQFSPFTDDSGTPGDVVRRMMYTQPYDLPFRPLAWHLVGHSELMPKIHAMLHDLDYTPGPKLLDAPQCQCFPKEYHRCLANKAKLGTCLYTFALTCLD